VSVETFLAVSIGAILGANARYLLGGFIAERVTSAFPWPTLVINVTGSFVIGIVLGSTSAPAWSCRS
jgi:CrcB protein